jgi:hypothetical protein
MKQTYNTKPLHETLARELGTWHGPELAAAVSVSLPCGFRPDPAPNQRAIWLPANGMTVILTFASPEAMPPATGKLTLT